jgi:uncharacterized repeat protein (TIGR02543 family)
VREQEIMNGGMATQPFIDRRGYTLEGWYTKNDNRWDFATSIVTQDTTLYAKWDTIKYSITYLLLEETEKNPANPDNYTIAHDTILLQPALPRAGHTWVGWFAKPDFSGGKVDTILQGSTGDRILYARWVIDTFKVTFTPNDGSAVDAQKVTYGGKATQPTCQRTGYALEGWYTEAECTTAWKFATDVVTQSITLYAKWDTARYEIILLGNGGYIGPNSLYDTIQEVTYQNPVGSLPAAHRKGYSFVEWNTKSNGLGKTYDAQTVYNTTGNMKLYAQWKEVATDPSSLMSLTICGVDGTLLEQLERDTITKIGNTIRYRLPCGQDIDSISVSYATPEGVNATITLHGTGIRESGDTVWVRTDSCGERSFSIKFFNEPKLYTVVIEKPYKLSDLVTEHLGNLRVVINNPLYNDGHTFKSCIWMDKNGQPIDSASDKLYYFAGPNPKTDKFSPDDSMYIILTTDKGRRIETCPDGGSGAGADKTANPNSLSSPNASAYPNPVRAGGKIHLKDAVLFDGEGERYSTFRLFSSQGQQVAGGNASDIASGLTMPDTPGSYYLILDGRVGRRTIHIAVGQ